MRIYLNYEDIKRCICQTIIPSDQLNRRWKIQIVIDTPAGEEPKLQGAWIKDED